MAVEVHTSLDEVTDYHVHAVAGITKTAVTIVKELVNKL